MPSEIPGAEMRCKTCWCPAELKGTLLSVVELTMQRKQKYLIFIILSILCFYCQNLGCLSVWFWYNAESTPMLCPTQMSTSALSKKTFRSRLQNCVFSLFLFQVLALTLQLCHQPLKIHWLHKVTLPIPTVLVVFLRACPHYGFPKWKV